MAIIDKSHRKEIFYDKMHRPKMVIFIDHIDDNINISVCVFSFSKENKKFRCEQYFITLSNK